MFPQQAARTPTSIGLILHSLFDLGGSLPPRSLLFFLVVLDQFGRPMRTIPDEDHPNNDETPYLTQTQINQILTFLDNRRAGMPALLNFPAGHTVGRIVYSLRDGDGTPNSRGILANVVQLNNEGQVADVHKFDDEPNLTPQQKVAIGAFLDAQRTKAVNEILG